MAIGRNLSRLLLRIEADTTALPAGLKRAETMTLSFSNKAKAAFGLARKAALAGAVAVTALGVATSKAIGFGDNIAKTADSIGLATDELQEYRAAAELAGVAQENLDKGLVFFTKNLGDLRTGSGAMFTVLDKVDKGFQAQLAATTTTSEALRLYLTRLGETENAADKASLAAAGFGRSAGVDMVNLVADGIDTLDQYRDRARELGLVIDEDLTRNAEDAQDTLFLLGNVIKTNVTTALLELAPLITEIGQGFLENVPAIRGWIREFSEFIGLLKEDPAERIAEIQARMRELREQQQTFIGQVRENVGFGPGALTRELNDLSAELAGIRSRQLEDDTRSLEATQAKTAALSAFLEQRRIQVELDKEAKAVAKEARDAERVANREREEEERKRANITDEINERLREQAELQAEAVEDVGQQASDTIGGIEQDLVNLAATGEVTAESLQRVFARAFQQIANDALRAFQGEEGSLFAAIGKALAGLGGPTTGNTGTGSFNGRTTFGGPRAGGGGVRAGVAYETGEGRQSEIFIPDIDGTIIPVSKMRGGGGGGGGGTDVAVIVNNNTGQPAQVSQRVVDNRKEIEVVIGNAVASDVRRNGPVGQSISQTFGINRQGGSRG